MLDDTDWYTDWDERVPRWVYCLPCTAHTAYEYAKANGWTGTIAFGTSSAVSNFTVEKLARDSGLKFTGIELRACYDRDSNDIIQAIIVWRDRVPEKEDDRKEVGKMVTYLKERLGLDPAVEPTWLLYNFQYQMEMDGIDDIDKPQDLTKFT